MIDICVVGFGAVGICFAYFLEKSGQARVTAVCRSNYRLMSDVGVTLELGIQDLVVPSWRPYRSVSCCADAADRQYAYMICCTKSLPDIVTTPEILGPLLQNSPAFLLIQNGVGIENDLQMAAPSATVLSACAWIFATLVEDGKKLSQTGRILLDIGTHQESPVNKMNNLECNDSATVITDLFRSGGLNVTKTDKIQAARWVKVLWNASLSPVCTLARCSVSTLMSKLHADVTECEIRALMTEVLSVAHACGINGPDLNAGKVQSIIEETRHIHGKGDTQFKPSMLVDLECGRPMEIEVLVGNITRKARQMDVATPRLDVIYAALRVLQSDLRQCK